MRLVTIEIVGKGPLFANVYPNSQVPRRKRAVGFCSFRMKGTWEMNEQYKRVTLQVTEEQVRELVGEATRLVEAEGEAYPNLCSIALAIWTNTRPEEQRKALLLQMAAEVAR